MFQIHTLGLHGNPLVEPLLTYSNGGTETVMNHLLDNCPIGIPPPERQWIELGQKPNPDTTTYSVFCYNVLCDKYATRQLYGYCPSWALDWNYRKAQILREIYSHGTDIVLLQEVETNEYHTFFRPQLAKQGYEGVFHPKSRCRTMGEEMAKGVDGCAVFWTTSKLTCRNKKLVEFDRLGSSLSSGSVDMLNRVMPKDNVAVLLVLEDTESKAPLVVGNAHLTWDPEFKDVKVIQSVMLMEEMSKFMEAELGDEAAKVPIILGGDFNSTPDSGVFEFITKGKISQSHDDLIGKDYKGFADKVVRASCTHRRLSHQVPLTSSGCFTERLTTCPIPRAHVVVFFFFAHSLARALSLSLVGGAEPQVEHEERVQRPNAIHELHTRLHRHHRLRFLLGLVPDPDPAAWAHRRGENSRVRVRARSCLCRSGLWRVRLPPPDHDALRVGLNRKRLIPARPPLPRPNRTS